MQPPCWYVENTTEKILVLANTKLSIKLSLWSNHKRCQFVKMHKTSMLTNFRCLLIILVVRCWAFNYLHKYFINSQSIQTFLPRWIKYRCNIWMWKFNITPCIYKWNSTLPNWKEMANLEWLLSRKISPQKKKDQDFRTFRESKLNTSIKGFLLISIWSDALHIRGNI